MVLKALPRFTVGHKRRNVLAEAHTFFMEKNKGAFLASLTEHTYLSQVFHTTHIGKSSRCKSIRPDRVIMH
jgi:hypothetical protein